MSMPVLIIIDKETEDEMARLEEIPGAAELLSLAERAAGCTGRLLKPNGCDVVTVSTNLPAGTYSFIPAGNPATATPSTVSTPSASTKVKTGKAATPGKKPPNRQTVESWLQQFPWARCLTYTGYLPLMLCEVCAAADKKSEFTSGVLVRDSFELKRHALTSVHRAAAGLTQPAPTPALPSPGGGLPALMSPMPNGVPAMHGSATDADGSGSTALAVHDAGVVRDPPGPDTDMEEAQERRGAVLPVHIAAGM